MKDVGVSQSGLHGPLKIKGRSYSKVLETEPKDEELENSATSCCIDPEIISPLEEVSL